MPEALEPVSSAGGFLLKLGRKSFDNYFQRATAEYFTQKYPGRDADFIVGKLISVASRNAALVGGLTGLAVSADELIALITGGEGLVGLPANIVLALGALAAEAALLLKIQMKLVAEIARVRGVVLDPHDPEDILTVVAYAVGGSAAEVAGKAGRRLGVKALERTVLKYLIPFASVGIGAGWNFFSTKAVGKLADRHFRKP